MAKTKEPKQVESGEVGAQAKEIHTADSIRLMPMQYLCHWEKNPRHIAEDEKLADMRRSIVEKGVKVPLIVRSSFPKNKFEVIAGNRRFRAISMAIAAKELPADYLVPCIVRELDDNEALTTSILENTQREDLKPMEEANYYQELMKVISSASKKPERAVVLKEIAARAGRSVPYIVKRMNLLLIPKAAAKALEEGGLSLAGALELARIPDAADRDQVWKRALEGSWGDNVVSADDIRERWSDTAREISKAPWKSECGNCTETTASQNDLFGDVKNARCLNSACWAKKLAEVNRKLVEKAKADGSKVATGNEAAKLLNDGRYVKLSDETPYDSNTWGSYVNKAERKTGVEIERIVCVTANGETHQLVTRQAADKARGLIEKSSGRSSGSDSGSAERRREGKRIAKVKKAVAFAIRKAGEVAGVSANDMNKLIEFLLLRFMGNASYDTGRIICQAVGIQPPKRKSGVGGYDWTGHFEKHVKGFIPSTNGHLVNMLGQIIVAEDLSNATFGLGVDADVKKTLKFFGVDWDACLKQVDAEEEKKLIEAAKVHQAKNEKALDARKAKTAPIPKKAKPAKKGRR